MHFETVASGLKFPEGPVWMLDGSVICTEIANGRISRIHPDGARETVATPGGGPNGAAIGPDGALYVCNNGGMVCHEQDDGRLFSGGLATPDYASGRIERIDLKTGEIACLYDSCDGRRLSAPNDIVFDSAGGFWFSDLGKPLGHAQENGGVFYATPDGARIKRFADGLHCVNGIGLSPDERTLYVALTLQRLVLAFDIVRAGEVAPDSGHGRVVASFPGRQLLDSLAVTADGHVCVAAFNEGAGIASVDPANGATILHPCPDAFTTNICFGGADMRDAWITQSSTGQLIKTRWDTPGHRLAFYA